MYGKFTFSKLNTYYDPEVYEQRLSKFCSQFTVVQGSAMFLRTLLHCEVFVLSGYLFQLLTLVFLKELDVVVEDDQWLFYLPPRLTKSAGSVKLLQQQAGFADSLVCRAYIVPLALASGVATLNLKNVFCKIHVGYYSSWTKCQL